MTVRTLPGAPTPQTAQERYESTHGLVLLQQVRADCENCPWHSQENAPLPPDARYFGRTGIVSTCPPNLAGIEIREQIAEWLVATQAWYHAAAFDHFVKIRRSRPPAPADLREFIELAWLNGRRQRVIVCTDPPHTRSCRDGDGWMGDAVGYWDRFTTLRALGGT